jgi:flagellar biogenesis protein FliO
VLNVKQDACRLYDKHLQLESSTADLPPRARFSSFDLLGQTLLCQQEDRLALVNVQDSQLVVAELAVLHRSHNQHGNLYEPRAAARRVSYGLKSAVTALLSSL